MSALGLVEYYCAVMLCESKFWDGAAPKFGSVFMNFNRNHSLQDENGQ